MSEDNIFDKYPILKNWNLTGDNSGGGSLCARRKGVNEVILCLAQNDYEEPVCWAIMDEQCNWLKITDGNQSIVQAIIEYEKQFPFSAQDKIKIEKERLVSCVERYQLIVNGTLKRLEEMKRELKSAELELRNFICEHNITQE